jgi:hypothetical protein
MTAKIRNALRRPIIAQTNRCKWTNLMVAGCSYVWNNSDEHRCTWPYYLQDLLGIHRVLDLSQSGSGPDLAFNAVINELYTNQTISRENTLIIVMWPELTRTDVIVHVSELIEKYHYMSLHAFSDKFCNLNICMPEDEKDIISSMSRNYKMLVDPDAQVYQSLIKIKALWAVLEQKRYQWVFVPWKHMAKSQLLSWNIPPQLADAIDLFDEIYALDDYTDSTNQRIPGDGHPTPDAHLHWTKLYLLPELVMKFPGDITSV